MKTFLLLFVTSTVLEGITSRTLSNCQGAGNVLFNVPQPPLWGYSPQYSRNWNFPSVESFLHNTPFDFSYPAEDLVNSEAMNAVYSANILQNFNDLNMFQYLNLLTGYIQNSKTDESNVQNKPENNGKRMLKKKSAKSFASAKNENSEKPESQSTNSKVEIETEQPKKEPYRDPFGYDVKDDGVYWNDKLIYKTTPESDILFVGSKLLIDDKEVFDTEYPEKFEPSSALNTNKGEKNVSSSGDNQKLNETKSEKPKPTKAAIRKQATLKKKRATAQKES